MSRREHQEKELKAILAKDIGAKNPIFSPGHIADIHAVFSLYADPRQRRTDIRDILLTASTLGIDQKYVFVYRVLQEMLEAAGEHALDFQTFIKELTAKIGNPFTEEGKRAHFTLLDYESRGELHMVDLKLINEQLHYGYTEDQLWEIMHAIGGYDADSIPFDKFSKFIHRKIERRRGTY